MLLIFLVKVRNMVKRLLETNGMITLNNLSLDYGFNQTKKSIKPLNDIIPSIVNEEYNENFINEMKHMEQEKTIHLTNLEDLFSD